MGNQRSCLCWAFFISVLFAVLRTSYSQATTIELQCDSWEFQYASCTTDGDVVDVTLQTQDSHTTCEKGVNFGFDGSNIWVDKGCRGKFIVTLSGSVRSELDRCLETCKDTACATDLDLAKGCNQMYSCSHACKMRELGVDEDSCKQHCDRNGQSGCFTEVEGYQFSLCSGCTRENCATWPSPEECEIGCVAYGSVRSELDRCLETCKDTACATDLDLSKGCNQMYSCSHACKMRELGVDEDSCKQHCDRNGQSGCNTEVEGYQFSLCSGCTRENCATWPTPEECEIGCVAYDEADNSDNNVEECVDKAPVDICEQRKAKGHCESGEFTKWAYKRCKATCGLCGCTDSPRWKDQDGDGCNWWRDYCVDGAVDAEEWTADELEFYHYPQEHCCGCGRADGAGPCEPDPCNKLGNTGEVCAVVGSEAACNCGTEPCLAGERCLAGVCVQCTSTANGATDSGGDRCRWYGRRRNWMECGDYDDEEFTANDMCCECGGGSIGV